MKLLRKFLRKMSCTFTSFIIINIEGLNAILFDILINCRTPMMDLLVQAASATKISPGGHVIHVFGEGDKGRGALQYKPSTPIGTLDTKTICIVPKKESSDPLARKSGKTANRPFEVSMDVLRNITAICYYIKYFFFLCVQMSF